VVDLVKGHIKAIEALNSEKFEAGGCRAYNLVPEEDTVFWK